MSNKDMQRIITDAVGRYNTDILTGWEAGMKGKERIGGKLFDRQPPDYFQGPRITDWYAGHEAAKKHRPIRHTHLIGDIPGGETIKIIRKGWVSWPPIVTRMERIGVRGDVFIAYTENGEIKRKTTAGI